MNRNSNPLLRLAIYLTAVIIAGCVVSPWAYWAGSGLAAAGILPFLDGFPFHRYFSRSIQISALILLWPAFWWIGISRLSELGIERNPRRWRDLAFGFAAALIPVVVLGAGYFVFELYRFRENPAVWGFVRILGTASIVAIIEEFLFRGVVLGLLLRVVSPVWAVLVSAAIFAGVHFLRIAKPTEAAPVTWLSGFEQLPLVCSSAPPWPLLGWGILSLMVAGVLLAAVTLRTKSLYLAIGLHAGWILGQQGIQWLGRFSIRPQDSLLPWVGPNVVSGAVPTGLLPVLVLLFTCVVVYVFLRRELACRR